MKLAQVGFPLERIATDILGEFPETENRNRYILVVSYYFTKWTDAFSIRNIEPRPLPSKLQMKLSRSLDLVVL